MSNFYRYLTKYLKTKSPWKVANSFVTNILDLSQLETEDGSKIKILKPAEDFYHKLILVWLTSKKNKSKIAFDEYLSDVRSSFGQSWKEKLVVPIKYFYDKVMKNWAEISLESGEVELKDEELMSKLLSRIRTNMQVDWERKIRPEKNK